VSRKRVASMIAAASLAISGGLLATALPASAATVNTPFTTSATMKAYAVAAPTGTWGAAGIGSTAPNTAAGDACLKVALKDVGGSPTAFYGGTAENPLFNGGGNVVTANLNATTFAPVGSCTINSTPTTWTGTVQEVSTGSVVFKNVVTAVDVDHGIKASSSAIYTVQYPSGSTPTLPASTADYTVTSLGSTATSTTFKIDYTAQLVSKAKLDKTACTFAEEATQTNAGPRHPGTWTSTYEECDSLAPFTSTFKSKKFTVSVAGTTGSGAVSLIQNNGLTTNPSVWDQRLGKCKVSDQDSRALLCKGDWGTPIAFTIVVRGSTGTTPGTTGQNILPAGLGDTNGLVSPKFQPIASGNL
jgi:hypothetical protein